MERTVIKENEVFLVSNDRGDIAADGVEGFGLYWRDTRFLSRFELRIEDTSPVLLSAAGEHSFMNNFQFANVSFKARDGKLVQARTISIRRNRFIRNGLHERIGLFNYNPFSVSLRLSITFGADFRDMFDVRGYTVRPRHGRLGHPEVKGSVVTLPYVGLDGVERQTEVRLQPQPTQVEVLDDDATEAALQQPPMAGISGHGDDRVTYRIRTPTVVLHYDLVLPEKQTTSITLHAVPVVAGERPGTADGPLPLDEQFILIRDSYRRWESEGTEIETDSDILNTVIVRAGRDLRLLTDQMTTGLLPSAGIPWFSVPFGRDSLISSIQTLAFQPEIAYGTLKYLAAHQGTETDDWRDEDPGKILHEIRTGEIAALREVPHTPYFGTVDATPLFIVAWSELLHWTGDGEFAAELEPNVEAALRWIDEVGDSDGDGFVDYASRSAMGIRNQGWKDSLDAVAQRDGRLAEPPIALAEVQGYVYDARRRLANYYRHKGNNVAASLQERLAAELQQRFLNDFYVPAEDFYAIALERGGTPVPVISSNPGHCLWSGLLAEERGLTVARRLLQEDMNSGWGIRTLGSHEPLFNPMSYHNGSVWPHDNAIIAAGLKRLGLDVEAATLVGEVLEAAMRFPNYRLPELYCGFARDRRYFSIPAQYPVSCSPQAWAAGSVFSMLQTILGLDVNSAERRIMLRPELPKLISRIAVRRLRVGNDRADFEVLRENGRVRIEVERSGGFAVEVEPPSTSSTRI
jgi:glycogen debranching enzyme